MRKVFCDGCGWEIDRINQDVFIWHRTVRHPAPPTMEWDDTTDVHYDLCDKCDKRVMALVADIAATNVSGLA